ncbi:peptide ABC transporter substrate-binding protein [Citroniella saccharovorans]|uniref:Peptide ABC transporter substrate-binding protein n=1 Tax=Citroniella saccharovorans TaxID=2053367 RepID=A0AAW9N0G4_9FIRM|nr:peptide ABC transporter substrate-binding protein [Citroniella saccharovorans]MEB3430160.1 peptide ABC transporter substrate-binding protein [Citroniella saccharovorans]
MKTKRILALLLAAMVMVFGLVACNKENKPSDTENKTQTTDENKKDDTNKTEEPAGDDNTADNTSGDKKQPTGTPDKDQFLNVLIDAQPNTLDPSKGSDMYGNTVLLNTLEPLVRIAQNKDDPAVADYVPAGAASWETSEDGLVWTFKLNDNKWSDGTPVTAKDYEFGIKRSADPNTASPFANTIYPIKNGEAVNKGDKPVEELGVKALDEKTLEITLEKPFGYFLDLVIMRTYFPQREDMVKQFADLYATAPENTPSCGPFILDSWLVNSSLEFKKNPEFWNAENVLLDKVHAQIIQDANTINTALETGQIDFASIGDPSKQAQFKENPELTYTRRENPWTGYLLFNFNENSPVSKSAKIRQAIAVALDRQELIDATMDGNPVPAYSFVPPTMQLQTKTFNTSGEGPLKEVIDEVKDPKALLIEGMKEAGLGEDPSKLEIKFEGSSNDPKSRLMSEFIKQDIESKLGIKLNVTDNDWNAFSAKLNSGEFDICWLAWGADFNDPSNFLETLWSKAPAYESQGYKNEKYDELIEKAQASGDADERIKDLKEAEKILIKDDMAIAPINHSISNIFRKFYVVGAQENFFQTMGWQTMHTEGR